MNMFKAVKAKTAKDYFAGLPPERREQMLILDKLIRKTAPKLKPNFLYNMPGYGKFPYKNHKGEQLMWPTIGIASQKNYISVYVCAVINGKYVAETNKKDLGKVSVGKSCIRFKKIEDVTLETLKKVIKLAEKHPGLTGAGEHKKTQTCSRGHPFTKTKAQPICLKCWPGWKKKNKRRKQP